MAELFGLWNGIMEWLPVDTNVLLDAICRITGKQGCCWWSRLASGWGGDGDWPWEKQVENRHCLPQREETGAEWGRTVFHCWKGCPVKEELNKGGMACGEWKPQGHAMGYSFGLGIRSNFAALTVWGWDDLPWKLLNTEDTQALAGRVWGRGVAGSPLIGKYHKWSAYEIPLNHELSVV